MRAEFLQIQLRGLFFLLLPPHSIEPQCLAWIGHGAPARINGYPSQRSLSMKCSFSALTIALVLGTIGSGSAWGQAVRGPVAYGGASATVTPASSYWSSRYAPEASGAPAPPPAGTTPNVGTPEAVKAPEPAKSAFG